MVESISKVRSQGHCESRLDVLYPKTFVYIIPVYMPILYAMPYYC
jgi:hypothetical protein